MSANLTTLDLENHLKKWFGHNTFRSYQRKIVENILQKKDVLAILPTGAGKSVCYQLPALLFTGVTIVVSPLISLMQDQVAALIKSGIPATYINSSQHTSEQQEIYRNLTNYKLVYIAPERLCDPSFLERLKTVPVSFFTIDEAHCISQWGHSFRPEYGQLSLIKKNFPDKPIMALTATATADVEKDISTQLMMQNAYVAKGSFDRPNLMIRINAKENAYQKIRDFLRSRKDQSGIIYAATRKTVDMIRDQLQAAGYLVGKYHAGMSDEERRQSLHDFIHDKTHIVVATVAFGMGINKPDVRFIIHHDMPQTIEQYYQEIGRAGRDGLPAECLMLYNGQDLMLYQLFCNNITDLNLRKQMESKTKLIHSFCQSFKCRRVGLLDYFGEQYASPNCNGCDNCIGDEETIDGTVIAQKILSCVYRLSERFGVGQVIDVLRGSKNSNVLQREHNRLSTYGLLSNCSEKEVRYYINSLLSLGFLKTSDGEYPVLQFTELSRAVIKGEQKVVFRKKIFQERVKEVVQLPYNTQLVNILRKLRLETAREQGVPPYVVFSDKALFEMATYFPHTDAEFLSINGVGGHKLAEYGTNFMKAIKEFCLEQGITPKLRAHSDSSKPLKRGTSQESFEMFMQGKSVDQIAEFRGCVVNTVLSHISKCIEDGASCDMSIIEKTISKERQDIIHKAIEQVGTEKLAPIKQLLPEEISYGEIRLVVALKCQQSRK